MELNREQIIQALEHCANYKSNLESCIGCPLYGSCDANILEGYALSLIKELTKENAYLKGLIDNAFIEQLKGFDEHSAARAVAEAEMWNRNAILMKELTEENERLTSLVKVITTNNADLETELAQTYDLLEEAKSDTVRKMQTEIKERCIKGGIYPAFVASTIDKIAKEMLEGENDNA